MTGAPLLLREVIRSLRETLKIEACIIIRDDLGGSPLRAGFSQLGRILDAEDAREWPARVDLIYANTCSNGLYVGIVSRRYPGVPVVTHIHELTDSILSFGRNNWEALVRHSDHFIASAAPARNHLVHNFHVAPERVHTIPPFCSPTRIDMQLKDQDPAIRAALSALEGCYVVGGAGWATFRKGVDFFFKLLDALPETILGRPVRLAWLGGHVESFLATIPEAKRHRVVAFGAQNNPFPFLARCDVLALTSREDTGPMVMFEAAYLRVPVVGFAGTGSIDEMAACGGAIALAPLDEARFAAAIVMLAHNGSYRGRMTERARSAVQQKFSDTVCLPRFAEVVGEIIRYPDGPKPLPRDAPANVWKESMLGRLLPGREGLAQLFFGPHERCSQVASFDRLLPAEAVFTFTVPEPFEYFRLDPDIAPGHFVIHELTLRSSTGAILMDLGVTHPWNAASVAGTAIPLAADGGLALLSYGEDPQIILPRVADAAGAGVQLIVRFSADYSSPGFAQLLAAHGNFAAR